MKDTEHKRGKLSGKKKKYSKTETEQAEREARTLADQIHKVLPAETIQIL